MARIADPLGPGPPSRRRLAHQRSPSRIATPPTVFCLLAGALALLIMHCLGPQDRTFIGASAILALLLTALYVLQIFQSQSRFVHFLAFPIGLGFAVAFPGRALVLAMVPLEWDVQPHALEPAVSAALSYAFLGFACLLLGYYTLGSAPRLASLGRTVWVLRCPSPVVLRLLALGTVVGSLAQSLLYWSSTWTESSTLGALPGHLVVLGTVAAWSLLFRHQRVPPATDVLIASVSLGTYVGASALFGHRGALLQCLIIPSMYWFIYGAYVPRWARRSIVVFGFVAIIAFPLFFSILADYKGRLRIDPYSTAAERYDDAIDTLRYSSASAQSNITAQTLGISRRIGASLDDFALTVEKTPAVWDYQYGRTIILTVYKFIPHALWPNKPQTSIDSAFYEQYYGVQSGVRGGGASPSAPGDLYLNFHVPGVIVGMFLLGFFVRALQTFCLGRTRDLRSPLGPVFLCVQAVNIATLYPSISDFVGNPLLYVAAVVFIAFLGSSRLSQAVSHPEFVRRLG